MKIINRCIKYDRAAIMATTSGFILNPQSLDYLLKHVESHPIPQFTKFRKKLLSLLKHKSRPATDSKKLTRILSALPTLKKDPELGIAAISKLTELLSLHIIPAQNKKIRIKCEDYYKCCVLQCLILKALISVMPRKKAIEYFGKFITKHNSTFKLMKLKYVVEKLNLHVSVKKGPLKNGAVFLQAVTGDGRAVMKITRCRPAEVVLKEVKDPQIVHAVICQPDFAMTKLSNPAFELTREKSLVLGMPYCGHVWHDRRLHKAIKHPSHKFWQELN
ncbi:MAG TPA: hypothetical protein DCL44_10560 [Elusimicrobia bacterium]|nr:hypothetical protein [Elusimicrobiota bacterium]